MSEGRIEFFSPVLHHLFFSLFLSQKENFSRLESKKNGVACAPASNARNLTRSSPKSKPRCPDTWLAERKRDSQRERERREWKGRE